LYVMEQIWKVLPVDEKKLSKIPVKSPVLQRLFYHRNLRERTSIKKFLSPSLKDLSDPFLHASMRKAVERIQKAVRDRETISIYGDYDADGLTASVILFTALKRLGAQIGEVYIPDRLGEGYGLHAEAIKQMAERGSSLLITVDTGIAAKEEVKQARFLGLDVIVTDHHQIQEEPPPALAVVHPRHPQSKHPYKDFSGAGMAWQLVYALSPERAEEFLDLAALGTVADLVPLTGENRILVKAGLGLLPYTRNPGLQALLEVAGLKGQKVTSRHLGYYLGPRLNAAGRVSSSQKALNLLLAENIESARPLAEELDQLNSRRQDLVGKALEKAFEMVGEQPPEIIFVADPLFSIGIAGLIAGKLKDRYSRPAVVVDSSQELCRGSARSVEGLDITQLLRSQQELLESFGGHAAAAGLSVQKKKLKQLAEALGKEGQKLDQSLLKPVLPIEAEVKFSEMTPDIAAVLEHLQPFGKGNPEPFFLTRDVVLGAVRPVGQNKHLQFEARDASKDLLSGIYFNGKREFFSQGKRGDIVFTIHKTNYPGRTPVEVELIDFKLYQ